MAAQSKKPALTHFLCIPLVTASSAPQWQASLDRFIVDAAGQSATTTSSIHNAKAGTAAAASSSNAAQARQQDPRIGTTKSSASLPDALVAGEHDPAGGASSAAAQNVVQSSTSSKPDTTAPTTAASAPPVRRLGPGLPVKAIRPLHSLHLTLGVMSLQDHAKIEEATSVLKGLDIGAMLGKAPSSDSDPASKSNQSPLTLSMRSLHPMQSPQATSVLYAEPHESTGRLLPFCQSLRRAFSDQNLVIDEWRDLKLHATIVNTLHAKAMWKKKGKKLPQGWGRAEQKPGKGGRIGVTAGRDDGLEGESVVDEDVESIAGKEQQEVVSGIDSRGKLDGRWLIEMWRDRVWAEVEVEKVAICELGAKADDHGVVRYKEIAEVSVP